MENQPNLDNSVGGRPSNSRIGNRRKISIPSELMEYDQKEEHTESLNI